MEDLYKKYEKCVEDINTGIGAQLNYTEKMCTGAEHQGSTVMLHQLTDQGKNRVDSLLNELQNLAHDANKAYGTTFKYDRQNFDRQEQNTNFFEIPNKQASNENTLQERKGIMMNDKNSEVTNDEEKDEDFDEAENVNFLEEPDEGYEAEQIVMSEDDVEMDSEEDEN